MKKIYTLLTALLISFCAMANEACITINAIDILEGDNEFLFNLKISLSFAQQQTNEQMLITITNSYDMPKEEKVFTVDGNSYEVTLTEIEALETYYGDNRDLYTLSVSFPNQTGCDVQTTFTPPAKEEFTYNSKGQPTTTCNSTTYSIDCTIRFNNAQHDLLIYDVAEGTETLALRVAYNDIKDLTEISRTLSNLPADGKRHSIKYTFDFASFQSPAASMAYDAPFMPLISSVTAIPSTVAAGDTEYSLTVDVNFENSQGKNLTVSDGQGHTQSLPALNSPLSFKFDNLPIVDGQQYTVSASFADASISCPEVEATYTSPDTPQQIIIPPVVVPDPDAELKTLSAKPSAISSCKQTEYNLTYLLTASYPQEDIIIEDNSTEVDIITVNSIYRGDTTYSRTIANLSADAATHTLTAYFKSDKSNQVQTQYDAPQVIKCKTYHDTLCLGQDYDLHGMHIEATELQEGDNTISKNNNTYRIYVMATPTITIESAGDACNSDKYITLTYKTIKGEPNMCDVKIDGTVYRNNMPISSGKINIPLSEKISAGKHNIDLTLESNRAITAEIDEVKISLVIMNLVENAIKYNKENGTVKVELDADHQYFSIKVIDTGIGIPQDSLDHIYERFYRVDKSRSREIGGTGLGLSIARNAVLMHRGSIDVQSTLGEGTIFTVRIPLISVGTK